MELNFEGKLKEYRTRCKNAGLTISYDRDLEVPYAQVSNYGQTSIHLPIPNPMWGKDEWIDWEYKAEHELGHLMPKCIDAYDILKKYKIAGGTFIASCLNLAEDNRQEWCDYYLLEGRRSRLNLGRHQFLKGQDASKLGDPKSDERMHAFQAWYCWDTFIRESWMPAIIGQGDRMLKYMTAQQLEWIDKLRTGNYEATLKSNLNAEELFTLTNRIIDEVFGFDSEKELEDAQEEYEKQHGTESTDDDADGDESGEGDGDEGSRTEEKGEKGSRDGTVKYADLLAHAHGSDDDGTEDNTSYTSLTIEYGDENETFTPKDPSGYTFLDYTNGYGSGAYINGEYTAGMQAHGGDGLAKHVRRLLQVRSATTYQHGLKRGKISPKSIYRAGNKGHPMETKVFKKKITNDVLNTAVFVLCDMSGSMGGDKMMNAGISCKLLNEAIGSIHIPLEIAGFDDHFNTCQHALWKSFSKAVTSNELVRRICHSVPRMMAGNSDGESVLWAYNRLVRRKEKRKILIVLSDGSPAGSGGDAMAYTKTIVKGIEDGGQVEIYGIGIMDRNVKLIYKHNCTIQRASELEAALLKVIKDKILN